MLRSENLSLDEISVPFLRAVHLFHFHLLILLSLPASELRLVISRYLSTNAILIIKNLHSPFLFFLTAHYLGIELIGDKVVEQGKHCIFAVSGAAKAHR
jgi:hypothetical protein